MRQLLVIAFLFLFSTLCAQTTSFEISGQLLTDTDKTPLESATIYLEREKDSSLVTYTISDKDGMFTLADETSDTHLNLFISYVGFETYTKRIAINTTPIDLKTIILKTDENVLDEVVITSRAPITIKKDTLEFNVKSFKTKKDATVEDLLKQLPGVEVDEEGKILVNGKEVSKILVNGKPFFGDDPTITTRNLTKDIIEKVQITDTKTKAEAFVGEEGDKENKTINLTVKEENNKGIFGRIAAGAGTDERYEFAGMINFFDNDRRVSVLAGGNNTNSPGFSFGEISKMFGRGGGISFNSNGSFTVGGRSFGGGQGITTSQNAGLNYADVIGETTEISTDYFYATSSSENESSSERETILADSRFFTNSNSRSENETDSHSINLDFEIETDSTFQINIEPSFSYSHNRTIFSREDASFNDDLVLTNKSAVNSNVESFARRFNNDMTATKRFGNRGGFVRLSLDTNVNQQSSDDFIRSETEVFGDNPDIILRNQYSDGENRSYGVVTELRYRYPIIAKKLFTDIRFRYDLDKSNNRQSTFDFNEMNQGFTDFNTELSTDFEFADKQSIPEIGVTYRDEKWSTWFRIGYNIRALENKDALRPQFTLERTFRNVQARYNFNYRFSPKASVYVGYSLTNSPPGIRQLQAFADVSNPLNIVIGNPNLSPSNRHNFYGGYSGFDWQKRTGFYTNFSGSITNNQVVARSVVDPETLQRTTTYDNVDGNYSYGMSANYSKDFKVDSLRTVKARAGINYNFNNRVNFNNDVQYSSKVFTISPSIGLEFLWNKVLDFKPYYRLNITKNTFDLNAFDDINFTTHAAGLRTATFLPKALEWRNDISFNYNPNVADGFQKSAWFWNSTVAYSILQDKGLISLKVYDLLNQNTNARRIANQDFIEDSQSTVLRRFFMLSFSYKFNSLGSKGETNDESFFFFD